MASYVPVVQEALQERLLVAAIDFGTTYSGYAFSFKYEYQSDPLKINANQWPSGSRSFMSSKTASCILFDPDRNFCRFGFEAEDYYSDLAMDGTHEKWFFFKNFKMLLYNKKNLKRDVLLEDDKGLTMPAMDVFSAAIRYLKDNMIASAKDRDFGLADSEIHWVLTVPAIWDDAAKQFMREAAVTAGIPTEQLSLSLEPEAAAMFCKYLPVERISGNEGNAITCFRPGSRYLVLDAGGGTIDITVHEVQKDGTMKELYKANGGPWGGTTIDQAYIQFFTDTMGKDLMDEFMKKYREDYLEFIREFEVKKRTIGPDLNQKVTFKIPISMNECFRDLYGQDFKYSLNLKEGIAGKMTFTGDKLRVDAAVVKGFFMDTCNQIVSHLRGVLGNSIVRNTDTILMVGGFSESLMLRDAVQKGFSNMRVIIPNDAGLAVLKGAVIFGHNPAVITARVCRFTYGVEMYDSFEEGKDSESKRVLIEDRMRCKDRFSRHVEVGQQVELNEELTGLGYSPLYRDQTAVAFRTYTSDKKKPRYIDEDGCNYLGVLNLEFQDCHSGYDRPLEVRMRYGGTELGVTAVEVNTGHTVHANFDFLG